MRWACASAAGLHWLWRAVDEHGLTLDVLLQQHGDTAAAARSFRRLLGQAGAPPERIVTHKLGSYAAALAQLPAMGGVEHVRVRSATPCNNRVEQAHQLTRLRERVMRRFKWRGRPSGSSTRSPASAPCSARGVTASVRRQRLRPGNAELRHPEPGRSRDGAARRSETYGVLAH
jgi:transposase-like protein